MNEQRFTLSLLTPGAFPDLTDNIIDEIEDFLLYAVDSEIQLHISNLVRFFEFNLSSFIRSQSLSIADQHYQKRLLRAMRFFRHKSLTPELSKILEDIAFSFLFNAVSGNALSSQSRHQAYVFLVDHFIAAQHGVSDRFPEFAKWSMEFIKLTLRDINNVEPSLYLTVLYSLQMLMPHLKKYNINIGQIVDILINIAISGMNYIKQSNYFDNLEIIISKTLRVSARLIQTHNQITPDTVKFLIRLDELLQADEIAFVRIFQNCLAVSCAVIQIDASMRTDEIKEYSKKILPKLVKYFPLFIQMPLLRSHRVSFYLKTVEVWLTSIKTKTIKNLINILPKVWNLISSYHGQHETIISASKIIQNLISPELIHENNLLQVTILNNLVSSLEIVRLDVELLDLNQSNNAVFEADLWLECNKQIILLIFAVIQCDMNQTMIDTYPITLGIFVRLVRYICYLLDLAGSVNQNDPDSPLSQMILRSVRMKEFRDQMTHIFDTFVSILTSLQPAFFHQLLSITMIDLLPRSSYRVFHKFLFTKILEKNYQILDFQTIFFATLADHFEELMVKRPPTNLLEITKSVFYSYFSDRSQSQQQQQIPQIQQMQNLDKKKDSLSYDLYRFLIKAITSKNRSIFELLLNIFLLYYSHNSVRFEPLKKIIFESPFAMHNILQMIIDEPKMKDIVSLFAVFIYPFCDIKQQHVDFWVQLFLPAIESDSKITSAAIPTLNKYTSRNFAQWVSQLKEPVQSSFVSDLAVSPREPNIRILLCKIPDIACRLTLRTYSPKKKESYVIVGGLKIDPEILFNSIKRNPKPTEDDLNDLFDAFCQHVGNMKFSEIIKDNLVNSMTEYIQKNSPSKLDTMYLMYTYPQTQYAALFLRQKYGNPITDVTVHDPNDFLQYISTLCYSCSTVDPALSIIEIFIDFADSNSVLLKINNALLKASQFRSEKCFEIISNHILKRDFSDDMDFVKELENHYNNTNHLFPSIRKNGHRSIVILENKYNLRNINGEQNDIHSQIKREILSLVNTLFKLSLTEIQNPFNLFNKVLSSLNPEGTEKQLKKIPLEAQQMFRKLGVIDGSIFFFNKIKLIFKILAKLIVYGDEVPPTIWNVVLQLSDKSKSKKLHQFIPYFMKRIKKECSRVNKTNFSTILGDYKILKRFQNMPPSYKELKILRFFIQFSQPVSPLIQQQPEQSYPNQISSMNSMNQISSMNSMNQISSMNSLNQISSMNSLNQMQNQMNPMNQIPNPMNQLSAMSSMNQMQNQMNQMQNQISSMNQMPNQMNQMQNQMNQMQNQISSMNSINSINSINSMNSLSSMNPMQNQMNPMQNQMNPMQSPMNPMQNQMNPMQSPMNSMNPMQNPMNQMQSPMNPMKNQMQQMYMPQMQPLHPMTIWLIKVIESIQSNLENYSIKNIPLIRKTEKKLKQIFKLTQQLKGTDPSIDIAKFCPIFIDFHLFLNNHLIPINTHFHYFVESWGDELLSVIIMKFSSMKKWRFELFLLIILFIENPKAITFRQLIIDQLSSSTNLNSIYSYLDTVMKKEITTYEFLFSCSIQCLSTIVNELEFNQFDFKKVTLLTINILKRYRPQITGYQPPPSMFINYLKILLPSKFANEINNDSDLFNFYKDYIFLFMVRKPYIQYFQHPLFTRNLVDFMKRLDESHRKILYSLVDSDGDPQQQKPILINQILCDKYKHFPEEAEITVGFSNFVKTPSFPVLILNFSAALLAAHKCVFVNDLAYTPILTTNSYTHALAINYKLRSVNSIMTLQRFISVIKFLSNIQDGAQPDGLIDAFTAKLDFVPYTLKASSMCFRALGQQNCSIDHTSRAITQFILGFSTTVLHSNSSSLDLKFVYIMPYVFKQLNTVKFACQRIFEILLNIVVLVLDRGNEGIAIAQLIPQTMEQFVKNVNLNLVDSKLFNDLKELLSKKHPSDQNPNQVRTKFILQLIPVLAKLLFDPISMKISIQKDQMQQQQQVQSKQGYYNYKQNIFFPHLLLPNEFFSRINYSKDMVHLYQKALIAAVDAGGYLVSHRIIQEMYDYLHKTTPVNLSLPMSSGLATIAEWIKELPATSNNIDMMKLFLEVMRPQSNTQLFVDLVSLKQPLHLLVSNFLINLLDNEFASMVPIVSLIPATRAFAIPYSIDVNTDCWRLDWFSMCQESHIHAFIRLIASEKLRNFVQFMTEAEMKKVITIILNTIPIRYNFQRFILYYITNFPRSSLSECFTTSIIFKSAPPYPTLPLFSNMTYLDLINMSDDSLGLLKEKSLELNSSKRKKSSAIFNACSFHQVFQFKAAKAYYLKGMNEEEDKYFYALMQLRSVAINMSLPLSQNLMKFILNHKKDNAFPVITLPFFQDTQTNFDGNQFSSNSNATLSSSTSQSYSLLNRLTSFISRSHIPFLIHSSLNGEVHQSLKMMQQPENVKNNLNEFIRVSNVMWIKALDKQMMMASNFVWRIAIMDDFLSTNEILSPDEQRQIRESVLINKNQVIRLLAKSGSLSVVLKHFPKASYPLSIQVTPQNALRIYHFIQTNPAIPPQYNFIPIQVKQEPQPQQYQRGGTHQMPIQGPFPVPIQNQQLLTPQIQLNSKIQQKPQVQPQIQTPSIPPTSSSASPQPPEEPYSKLKNNLKIILRDFRIKKPSKSQWIKIIWRLLMTNMKNLVDFPKAVSGFLKEIQVCQPIEINSLIATVILLISEQPQIIEQYTKQIIELGEYRRLSLIDWLPQLVIACSKMKSIKTIHQFLNQSQQQGSSDFDTSSNSNKLFVPEQIIDSLIQANPISFIMTVNEMSYSNYYSSFSPIGIFVNEIRTRLFKPSIKNDTIAREEIMIREYEKAMGWTEKCQKDINRLVAVVSCHRLMYESTFRPISPAELNNFNMTNVDELFEFCKNNSPVFSAPSIHMTDYQSVKSFIYRKHEHVIGIMIDSDGHNEAELRMNLVSGETKVMQIVSPDVYSLSKREKILTDTFMQTFSKQAASPTRSACFCYPRSNLIHENLLLVESDGFVNLSNLIQPFNVASLIKEEMKNKIDQQQEQQHQPAQPNQSDGSFINNGATLTDESTPAFFFEKKCLNIPDDLLFKWLLIGSEGSTFDFLFIRQSFTSYYAVSSFLHFIFQTQLPQIPSIMLFKDRQRVCIPDFFFNKRISRQYIITSDQLKGAIPRFMMYGTFSSTWHIITDSLYLNRERIRIVMRALVHQEQRLFLDSQQQIHVFQQQNQLNNQQVQQYAKYLSKDVEMVRQHKKIMSQVFQRIEKFSSMAMTEETEKCDEVFPFLVMDHLIENSWNVAKAQPIACGWV